MARSHSTKTSLRFGLIAIGIWLSAIASHAFAQDASEITLKITPCQAAAIVDAMDARGRLPELVSSGWVEVANELGKALDANPKNRSEFDQAYQAVQRRDG